MTVLYRPSKVDCFTHLVVFFTDILIFFVSSSFGRQLSAKCRRAGLEPYVQTHITVPPGFVINSTFQFENP